MPMRPRWQEIAGFTWCAGASFPAGCDEPFMKPKDGQEAVWECKHQPTCGGTQDAVL